MKLNINDESYDVIIIYKAKFYNINVIKKQSYCKISSVKLQFNCHRFTIPYTDNQLIIPFYFLYS